MFFTNIFSRPPVALTMTEGTLQAERYTATHKTARAFQKTFLRKNALVLDVNIDLSQALVSCAIMRRMPLLEIPATFAAAFQ